jgi:hypothetical protein
LGLDQLHAPFLIHQAPPNPAIAHDTPLYPYADHDAHNIFNERPELPFDDGSTVAASSEFMEDAKYVFSAPGDVFDDSLHYNIDAYHEAQEQPQGPITMNGHGDAATAALCQTQPTGPIQPTIANPPQPFVQNSLACPHGCRGSFNRPGEYRRHRGKHRAHQHICLQPGCGKTFYRKDKLADHLRQLHKITPVRRTH